MQYLPHQVDNADKALSILKEKAYVYIAGKPRSGKTATALLTAELTKLNRWLILAPKNALEGWYKFLEDKELNLQHSYYITNYEQVGRLVKVKSKTGKTISTKVQLKLNPNDYDGVIIDESHNLGTLGKPSGRSIVIKHLCYNLPHIHLSGTAIVESQASIYHQMYISKYNPFPFKNFYDFHREYGKPYTISAGGREINQYDRVKDTLLPKINEFTIYMTQEDAGIDKSIQATDVIHYIELDTETKELYNTIQNDRVIEDIFDNKDLVCDSVMKLRTTLHMVEGGSIKIDKEYYILGNTEKVEYIKETFGDTNEVGIMCHFIGDRKLLQQHFKRANIYSSNAHAEGVDLSHLKYFIIYSSDYRGSKFIQRRERIININGSNTLEVHHLLVKKAISEQVYKTVSKKHDFNNKTYEHTSL